MWEASSPARDQTHALWAWWKHDVLTVDHQGHLDDYYH